MGPENKVAGSERFEAGAIAVFSLTGRCQAGFAKSLAVDSTVWAGFVFGGR